MICNLNIMKNTKKTDQEKNFEQKKVQIADKVELFFGSQGTRGATEMADHFKTYSK